MKNNLIATALLLIAAALLSPLAHAGVVYTYTGNAFYGNCPTGESTCGFISGTIELSAPIAADTTIESTSDVIAEDFTATGPQGSIQDTSLWSASPSEPFFLETDMNGNVVNWSIFLGSCTYYGYCLGTSDNTNPGAYFGIEDTASNGDTAFNNYNVNDPGTWECTSGCTTSAVPESGTDGLTLIVLGFLWLGRKRLVPSFR
jgi:hypothetical protein